ncbi:glucosaminidase domain-containing protein [Paradesertivirga mongoliensis]|uniref:Peptidoglycan hydrolase n=1 Tax=Paradesertivirga mongoliensis TaxID=2100740 RepID=A0ABW4ZHN0_9SPHI|nr:glucosaminidase domain-containing protein [Pedobacter mongoliensis]
MRIYILIACAALSMSCTTTKAVIVKKETSKPTREPVKVFKTNTLTKNLTSLQYIEQYKGIAIEEMLKSGIPASITLAQGLLESASGNSTLATEANNHFGIKCNTTWTGPTILKDDDAAGECFRVYQSAEESYRDHTEFLKRARYTSLFQLDRNDYRGWAHGLKQAGYATNPKYAQLLIDLIERYQLDQYDRAEKNVLAQSTREEKVITEIIKEEPKKPITDAEKTPLAMKIYEVKQGDTLYSISRRFGLTVDDIKILNSLQVAEVKLGQLLLVSK